MSKPHEVSVVAIFRNEHRYIVQWVDYHLKVGVSHLYLYDNGGDHWPLLEPFSDHITYVKWTDEIAAEHYTDHPKLTRQTKAYTHCIDHFRHETEWLQLLDLDEFLVPLHRASLTEAMASSAQIRGVLRVPRINFGNAGHRYEPITDIRQMTRRERYPSHFKDMGRMNRLRKVKNPHVLKSRQVTWSSELCIHHHYTRTLPEWMQRAKMGGGQARKGFRWFIGQRPWLAYLTYFFLNTRSLVPLLGLFILNGSLLATTLHPAWWLANLPLVSWFLFAWRRGQNEVFDPRLRKLYSLITSSNFQM